VLNSLGSPASRRVYEYAIDQFIGWYCSEPRLAFNRIVVVRYRMYLESHGLAANTINQQLAAGRKAEDVAREVGVSKHTIYAWKAKYGGMDVSEAQEAKQLRDENTKLKKLVVDLSLDKEMLKALIAKNGWSS
jgi:putative transposase